MCAKINTETQRSSIFTKEKSITVSRILIMKEKYTQGEGFQNPNAQLAPAPPGR